MSNQSISIDDVIALSKMTGLDSFIDPLGFKDYDDYPEKATYSKMKLNMIDDAKKKTIKSVPGFITGTDVVMPVSALKVSMDEKTKKPHKNGTLAFRTLTIEEVSKNLKRKKTSTKGEADEEEARILAQAEVIKANTDKLIEVLEIINQSQMKVFKDINTRIAKDNNDDDSEEFEFEPVKTANMKQLTPFPIKQTHRKDKEGKSKRKKMIALENPIYRVRIPVYEGRIGMKFGSSPFIPIVFDASKSSKQNRKVEAKVKVNNNKGKKTHESLTYENVSDYWKPCSLLLTYTLCIRKIIFSKSGLSCPVEMRDLMCIPNKKSEDGHSALVAPEKLSAACEEYADSDSDSEESDGGEEVKTDVIEESDEEAEEESDDE
jgi:hypothetical protein